MKRLLVGLLAGALIAGSLAWAQQVAFQQSGTAPTVSAAYDQGLTTNVWRDFFHGGHIVAMGGTAPTCSAACGSVATIAGQDTGMRVTTSASGLASPIVVTFSRAYALAPACTAANNTTAANYVTRVLTTTTTASVYFAAGPTAADVVSIVCVGAGG
jgi:hypothetical protein